MKTLLISLFIMIFLLFLCFLLEISWSGFNLSNRDKVYDQTPVLNEKAPKTKTPK